MILGIRQSQSVTLRCEAMKSPSLEGRRPVNSGADILRGSLRSRLRMTGIDQ
jgi:hypothetical protein